MEAQENYTGAVNKKREEKKIEIGDRVFAKLKKQISKKKLDFPVDGPFIIKGMERKGYILEEIEMKKRYVTHGDNIVVGRGTPVK